MADAITTGVAAAVAAGTGVVLVAVARSGRLRFGVRCWFCDQPDRVPWSMRNGWTCRPCGQYNGFGADGGYNRDVPGMTNEMPASRAFRFAEPGSLAAGTSGAGENGLCQSCNLNQSLKAHQLAKFEPRNEHDYDREVEIFAEHLEKTYRLCRKCEAILHQSLGEQNSWLKPTLLSWKLESNRKASVALQQRMKSRQGTRPIRMGGEQFGLRLLTLWAAIALFLLANYPSTAPKELAGEDPHKFQAGLASVIALFWTGSWARRPASFSTVNLLVASAVVSAVWISSFANDIRIIGLSPYAWTLCIAGATVNLFRSRAETPARKRRRKRNSFSSPLAVDQTSPSKSNGHFPQTTQISNSFREEALHDNREKSDPGKLHDEVSVVSTGSQTSDHTYAGDCDISTLSIEEDDIFGKSDSKGENSRSPSAFSLRSYEMAVPSPNGINFGGGNSFRHPGGRSSLLRPSRLIVGRHTARNPSSSPTKGVVKASWVAGGYWQNAAADEGDTESLSRASSQSSGFVSQSGQSLRLPNQLVLPPPPPAQRNLFGGCSSPTFLRHEPGLVCSSRANSVVSAALSGDALERVSLASEHLAGSPGVRQRLSANIRRNEDTLLSSLLNNSGKNDGAEATLEARPQAESSPLLQPEDRKKSILDAQISVNFSLSSLLLVSSFVLNLTLCCYLFVKVL